MERDKFYLERIDVESYSGYKLHESPRKFIRGDEQYVVQENIDLWYEGCTKAGAPVVNYFKVRADDGKQYLIRYDSFHDEWTIVIRPSNIG